MRRCGEREQVSIAEAQPALLLRSCVPKFVRRPPPRDFACRHLSSNRADPVGELGLQLQLDGPQGLSITADGIKRAGRGKHVFQV